MDPKQKIRENRGEFNPLYRNPGPNKYNLPGSFDFKDPNDPEQVGKVPKFHFGMNTKARDRNLDMPGPGEYDMNVYPSNQANICH